MHLGEFECIVVYSSLYHSLYGHVEDVLQFYLFISFPSHVARQVHFLVFPENPYQTY